MRHLPYEDLGFAKVDHHRALRDWVPEVILGEGKVDSAIVVFQKNVKDYPKSWNTYDSLGEAYAIKGDKKKAREQYGKALAMTKNPAQQERINGILAGLK